MSDRVANSLSRTPFTPRLTPDRRFLGAPSLWRKPWIRFALFFLRRTAENSLEKYQFGYNLDYFSKFYTRIDILFKVNIYRKKYGQKTNICSVKGVNPTVCSFHSLLISLAGMPPTTVFASTSLVTTEPAPTMAFSPTVTPGRMVAPAPIQQLRFSTTGLQVRI